MRVSGILVRNGRRVQVTIHEDGTSDEREETGGQGAGYSYVHKSGAGGSTTMVQLNGSLGQARRAQLSTVACPITPSWKAASGRAGSVRRPLLIMLFRNACSDCARAMWKVLAAGHELRPMRAASTPPPPFFVWISQADCGSRDWQRRRMGSHNRMHWLLLHVLLRLVVAMASSRARNSPPSHAQRALFRKRVGSVSYHYQLAMPETRCRSDT